MITICTFGQEQDDFDRLLSLINLRHAPRVVLTERGLRHLLATPGYHPHLDAFLATDGESGTLLAARDVRVTGRGDEQVRLFESWRLGAPNVAAGPRLLETAERRTCEMLREAGLPTGILQTRCAQNDQATSAELKSAGFTFARPLMSMVHDHPADVVAPSVPSGIIIRNYRKDDDNSAWIDAFNDAFSDHWGGFMGMNLARWQHSLADERFDPTLSLIAEADGEIAGFCHNLVDQELNALNNRKSGMVRYVGVAHRWRGIGLGSALTRLGIRTLVAAGMNQVDISVDAENTTGAHVLYERLGFSPTGYESVYRKVITV